ncbi:MAG: hypothetical protein Q4A71_05330 [Actinomycetaceae bacterium]|nr:hypothetical protein [Actinomycetaceae bacterium]
MAKADLSPRTPLPNFRNRDLVVSWMVSAVAAIFMSALVVWRAGTIDLRGGPLHLSSSMNSHPTLTSLLGILLMAVFITIVSTYSGWGPMLVSVFFLVLAGFGVAAFQILTGFFVTVSDSTGSVLGMAAVPLCTLGATIFATAHAAHWMRMEPTIFELSRRGSHITD